MKPIIFALLIFVTAATHSLAEEAKSTEPPKQPAAEKPKLSQAELEAKFKSMLTNATLTGRWCLIRDGQMTPEKEEKYTISGVTKLAGKAWLIHTRIQYGKKDFKAPVPVIVEWAGDTAVIVLDNIAIPGSGTFSARVLFHDDTYAGTWSGGDHAGLLNGVISREKEAKP